MLLSRPVGAAVRTHRHRGSVSTERIFRRPGGTGGTRGQATGTRQAPARFQGGYQGTSRSARLSGGGADKPHLEIVEDVLEEPALVAGEISLGLVA
jgi:hypothetical protein